MPKNLGWEIVINVDVFIISFLSCERERDFRNVCTLLELSEVAVLQSKMKWKHQLLCLMWLLAAFWTFFFANHEMDKSWASYEMHLSINLRMSETCCVAFKLYFNRRRWTLCEQTGQIIADLIVMAPTQIVPNRSLHPLTFRSLSFVCFTSSFIV
jgi:hypothetical protein